MMKDLMSTMEIHAIAAERGDSALPSETVLPKIFVLVQYSNFYIIYMGPGGVTRKAKRVSS